RHFWAAPFEMDAEFGGMGPDPNAGHISAEPSRKEKAMMMQATKGANTTIAIVATDAPFTKTQCHRLAVTAHDGMARAIVPSHTPLDGDLVFGVATGEGAPVDQEHFRAIAAAGAVCLSRAIARGVYEASAAPGDLLPTYRAIAGLS
ncbi:MAG: P1 family peptidase, partial [Pseudomonadota bacterium]